jgi:hypothetical protein
MGVVDWRSWTAQSGGTLPTAPNPPGIPAIPNSMFPGVGPITDLINGATSIPNYPNVPTYVPAVDPFYVGTYPTGGGWVAPMERYIVPSPGTPGTPTVPAWPAGSPGATVPAGPIQRPVVPGVTS